MRQSRRTRARRRWAAMGGLVVLVLAAVAVGVVWSDQSAAADAGVADPERTAVTATVRADPDAPTLPATPARSAEADVATTSTTATAREVDETAAVQATAAQATAAPATAAPATAASTTAAQAITAQAAVAQSKSVTLKVYFVKGEKLVPATRQVAWTKAVGSAALEQLLAGPTKADKAKGMTSAVPAGVKLRGLNIKNGVATVDLTGTFGTGGGSASMHLRLGQIVYTLTEFPTVDAVSLRIDGKVVKTLGGEGLVLSGPLSRTGWARLIG